MFKTYIIIALRNLKRHKKYTMINLGALSLGLVPVILLLLYVEYELGFDQYHAKADRIYRPVEAWVRLLGERVQSPLFPAALAPAMADELPEVVSATRLWRSRRSEVEYGEKRFVERNLIYADQEIFDVFSFELLKGNPETVLAEPQSIVLSEKMVEKYFGDKDPLGKTLTVDFRSLQVTGVLKNIPKQSHFLVDFLVPANLIGRVKTRAGTFAANSWGFPSWFVYFLLEEGADVHDLEKKFRALLKTHISDQDLNQFQHFFQPLTDIHLHSHLTTELRPNGDIKTVYIYATFAVIILLIACISYINLATMRSAERAREVGVRKVVGAHRRQLIVQFLGESTVLTLFAAAMAILIAAFILPSFNSFVEREIELADLFAGRFLLWLSGVIVFVSLCSGSYPALVLSAFKPAKIFRSRYGGARSSRFRIVLIVTQLAVSMLFFVAALIMRDQLDFARQKDMGYRKDQIVTSLLVESKLRRHLDAIKTELARHPNVAAVSSSSILPNNVIGHSFENISNENGRVTLEFHRLEVDFNFIELFEMEIIEGRDFSVEFSSDASEALIVNETAVRAAGWEFASGQYLDFDGKSTGKVIGVVKDFHFKPLHQKITPLYLWVTPVENHYFLSVKIATENIEQTLSFIKNTITKIYPKYEFNYTFFDETFDEQYKVEQKLARLFNLFTAFAIVIACIGLFGLVSLMTEQRTKEIGIRKVFGASAVRISALLTRDFAKWVLLASIVAWPVAWYGANKWLQTFAYRVEINWGIFLLASALLLAIVLLTVGCQAFRAASANPVDALRYE